MFGNSYIPCLLLIITILFTCGDTKILSNIKMSQNIMTRIVVLCGELSQDFSCVLCWIKEKDDFISEKYTGNDFVLTDQKFIFHLSVDFEVLIKSLFKSVGVEFSFSTTGKGEVSWVYVLDLRLSYRSVIIAE